MNASEAKVAREEGICITAHEWITKIELEWERHLGTGRDNMWVKDDFMRQQEEVIEIVTKHFLKLGYGFERETTYGYYCDEEHYRMRITPRKKDPKERGILFKLFVRLFGGQHVSQ